MASNDASTPAEPVVNGNHQPADKDASAPDENDASPPAETVFTLQVKLPHEPFQTQIQVSTQEQVQDIRQSIADQHFAMQYSCFHLEHNGERVNDFIELSEVPGIGPESTLSLVEDPYTEKEARMHVVRIREFIGAAGDRTDTIHGVSAGLSLHDYIADVSSSAGSESEGDTTKTHADIAAYGFDAPASLKTLLQPDIQPAPKTVKSISVSAWNPPPYHLRTRGHLLYLVVMTNEGEQHHITSHVSGFYVNKSSQNKFDPFPRPAPKNFSAHSLLTLLKSLSPSFESSFESLLEHNSKRDPLSLFQLSNAIPASPWLVKAPSSSRDEHQLDITRTQESFLLSGAEPAETLRDWNEEFQSTRELPRESVQDKVFRERLTNKLFADYNEAATRGAVLVARGEVPPLNPTEGKDAQIYVYNNIFYSFGADGVGTFATEGGDEAARVATGKDVMGVKAVNQLDIPGLFTPGTVVVDYLGKRIVGQSIVPGIFKQREPGEHQIDYGGVEGKDIVAENEAFVPLFEKLSLNLHVKKHAVWDKEKARHDLEGSVETKGLLGTDGRKYVLDLYRTTPLDVTWLEQYWSGTENDKGKDYPHRMAVLRPELIESYARLKLREFVDAELAKRSESSTATTNGHSKEDEKTNGEVVKAEDAKEGAEKDEENNSAQLPRVDISSFRFSLNPDVFSGQDPQTDAEQEEYRKDEAEVRLVCDYLTAQAIPRLIHELQEGDVGFPMDGESLTTLLHKRGINIRYLGTVAKLADSDNPRLMALQRLALQEMVVRGFKHVANEYLKHLPSVFAPACVAHLLNCLLGESLNPEPTAEVDESLKNVYSEADFGFEKLTSESLRSAVLKQVQTRYRFQLDKQLVIRGREIQMLREIALRLGLQIAARDFVFDVTAVSQAITNGVSKKKKKSKDGQSPQRSASPTAAAADVVFHPEDIVNFVPKVKESSPKSTLAEEAFDGGRMSLAQDQKELGQELLLESLSLYEQIYNILHPEVARVYLQLSTLYYGLDEKGAAVELARKAVIVAERTLGVDSSETILSYLNLGLFEHANGNSKLALSYVLHALELWKIVYGPNHPDSITTINNAAVMLQSMKRYHDSRVWFEACLAISEEVSGKNSVNTATLLFQLAQALALDQDSHAAVNRMRESCTIFRTALGPDDRNTKEAEQWLDQLTQSAVSLAKRAKDLQSGKLRRVHFTTRVPVGAKPLPQIGQSPADALQGRVTSRDGTYVDNRNIDDLIKYIDGSDEKQKKKSAPSKKSSHPKRRAAVAA